MSRTGRSALRPAYLRTSYIVHAPGQRIDARIEEPCPALDALLARQGASTGVFITAVNPKSAELSPEENAAANRALEAALAAAGVRALPHEGVADKGDWSEKGFFALGLGRSQAVALAERFGQYAVVFCEIGRKPALLFTRLAQEPRQQGLE
jgi:hypothetical protein